MQRQLASFVVPVLLASCLAGCEGCGANRRAEAQSLDAGAAAGPSVMAPASCYLSASQQTNLTDAQILNLCQGAHEASGPVQCFLAADRSLRLTDAQSIALCRCARSTEPVECYQMVDRETFLTDLEITRLCSPTIAQALLANCRPAGW